MILLNQWYQLPSQKQTTFSFASDLAYFCPDQPFDYFPIGAL